MLIMSIIKRKGFYMPNQFKTKSEIIEWLDKFKIQNATINENLVVDVKGDVFIDIHSNKDNKFPILPIQFGTVTGDFIITSMGLSSLVGCPHSVYGNFNVAFNELQTVDYFPSLIGGEKIILASNKLTEVNLDGNKINKLYLNNNLIPSINNLTNYDEITHLFIGGNPLMDLTGCPSVQKLSLTHIRSKDFSLSLKGINQDIEDLNMSDIIIDDLEEMSHCKKLHRVVMPENTVTLKDLPPSVRDLDLTGAPNFKNLFELLSFRGLNKLSIRSTSYEGQYLDRYFTELELKLIEHEQEKLNNSVSQVEIKKSHTIKI
jgi:hypothetical protein